jgi:hypothetical protein
MFWRNLPLPSSGHKIDMDVKEVLGNFEGTIYTFA